MLQLSPCKYNLILRALIKKKQFKHSEHSNTLLLLLLFVVVLFCLLLLFCLFVFAMNTMVSSCSFLGSLEVDNSSNSPIGVVYSHGSQISLMDGQRAEERLFPNGQ